MVEEERKARSSSADRIRPRRKALDFALACLARRDHGTGELSEKLKRAGYAAGDIDSTLQYLSSRRYLDDARFASNYAKSARERKLWGPARIENRLRELRLPELEIDRALEAAFPSGEEETAARALERYLRRTSPASGAEKAKAKAYRHLLSRGFSPSVAHRLVSRDDFEDTEELG